MFIARAESTLQLLSPPDRGDNTDQPPKLLSGVPQSHTRAHFTDPSSLTLLHTVIRWSGTWALETSTIRSHTRGPRSCAYTYTACTYIHVRTHIHIHIHIRTQIQQITLQYNIIHIHAHIYTCIHIQHTYIHTYTCTYMHTHLHTYAHMHIYYTYTCMRVYTTYMHIYTYTHTHMPTHIYSQHQQINIGRRVLTLQNVLKNNS